MTLRDITASVTKLCTLFTRYHLRRKPLVFPDTEDHLSASDRSAYEKKAIKDWEAKEWDAYWMESTDQKTLFSKIAKIYRKELISRSVGHYFHKYFEDKKNSIYLHAGCGSAGSDSRIRFNNASFVLLDQSFHALRLAHQRPGCDHSRTFYVCGDLFNLPFREESFDGLWNLGVMEHFYPDQVHELCIEYARTMKEPSPFIFFWPPFYGFSVIGLSSIEKIANKVFRKNIQFFPNEVNYFSSRKKINKMLEGTDLRIEKVHFCFRDFFTNSVAVGNKDESRSS